MNAEKQPAVAGPVEPPAGPFGEPLFLLHTGDIFGNERDEWEVDAYSQVAVDKLCEAQPPGTVLHLYALTPEQVTATNDLLAHMEKAKAERDAAMADAARFRWIDEHALSVDMMADPDNLVQVWRDTLSGHPVTGRTLREAVDEAMKRNSAYPNPPQPE